MRSAVRQAIAWIVSDGLTPPTVGKHRAVADPQIRDVPAAAVGVDHARRRVVAHARGAVHVAGVVGLLPDVGAVDRLQRLRHELQRVPDQRLVVVAPRVLDTRDRQAVLVLVVGQRDAVALLRQHLADDLQPDLMVVVGHRLHQAIAPQPVRGGLRVRPQLRQRPLAHVGSSRRRNPCGRRSSSARSSRATAAPCRHGSPRFDRPQTAWFDCTVRYFPTRPELLASPSG